ncbi:hypothetical protein V512_008065 [Mesotoga sp. Brook.08.105.5.1]|nr:hypothetical protein V512_008065 [Mesotoga sp. Brook.08.105.5.1]RAO97311.1 hypothetical protein M388_00665 [Mesotoga sp. Brook.08.YT.4.2.5.4.]
MEPLPERNRRRVLKEVKETYVFRVSSMRIGETKITSILLKSFLPRVDAMYD